MSVDVGQQPPPSPAAQSGPTSLDRRRLDAFRRLDEVPLSFFHANIAFVAGAGFFTDAYDIFAITIAQVMIGLVYGSEVDPTTHLSYLKIWQVAGLKVSTLGGNIVGQLLFGWLADRYGRKRMYGIELIIIIIATIGQAVSSHGPVIDIVSLLIVWRFILGVGIGADYPTSAIIASELASVSIRGSLMTSVFACQGWGQLAASLVGLVVVVTSTNAIDNSPQLIDYGWRLLIGLGCVPAVVALYFRLTISETPRFEMDVLNRVRPGERYIDYITANHNRLRMFGIYSNRNDAQETHATGHRVYGDSFFTYFLRRENLWLLLGTAWSWFALDVAFYILTLDNSTLSLQIIQRDGPSGAYQNLYQLCYWNIILILAGYIPGFIAAFFVIDRWGRRPLQLMGFVVLIVLFFIMGFGYDKIQGNPLFALYCISNFFLNFGPNTTTFIVPAELFPTRYRATAYGIAAASGKLGAVIALVVFTATQNVSVMLEVLSFVMMTGVLSTLLVPETMNRGLEDLFTEVHGTPEGNGINHNPMQQVNPPTQSNSNSNSVDTSRHQ